MLYLNKLLLFFFLLITGAVAAQTSSGKNLPVLAYYAGGPAQLDSFDVNKITHLIYCFGHLQGTRLHFSTIRDTLLLQQMVAQKKRNPALKILISFGGWGGCATCSAAFASDSGRIAFTRSVKEAAYFFGTDGIDIDWEYPAIENFPGHSYMPEDKQNFTALIKDLRSILGKHQIISFAAGGFTNYLEASVDWKKILPYVDYINLMTYDLVSGFATKTGHHTALYSTPQQKESTDNAVQNLLKRGVPSTKLVIGGAFYARIWQNVADVNNGLYQGGTFQSAVSFKNFSTGLSKDSGYVYYWDSTAHAPYAYNKSKGLFATFDDISSTEFKTKYAIDHKLGGIMFWQLSEDLYTDGMLDAIDRVKKEYSGIRKK